MNDHLRLAIDHLREGVQVISSDWRYLYLNETAAAQGRTTAEALIGRRMQECYPGIDETDLFRVLARVLQSGRPERLRNEFVHPNGDRRWFDLRVEPVPAGLCVLSMDVTDDVLMQERLRSVETQLQQAQKMEAIGRLAGGIAHDFNNQLTVILGFAQMLLEQHADSDLGRDLREIEAATHRCAGLIKQLLALGKRQNLRSETVWVDAVVRDVARLLARLLGERVTCTLEMDPAAAPILADRGQLEHVLTNLAVNARDAMPAGGQLTISAATQSLSVQQAMDHAGMRSGRYTVLTVADTGHGMDEQTRARIFEPFFTTKERGQGTGLGLSMVYSIVKQMSGFIDVESQPGNGTTFRMYFPVAPGETPTPSDRAHAVAARPPLQGV